MYIIKKLSALILALLLMLAAFTGCGREKTLLTLPFDAGDVVSVDMYNYTDPADAQKKTLTDPALIAELYEKFAGLSVSEKEIEAPAGAEVFSFRFYLGDGSSYSLIYTSCGVKKGILRSTTAGFEYFTSANVGWCWGQLARNVEATPAAESELPGHYVPQDSDDLNTPPAAQ